MSDDIRDVMSSVAATAFGSNDTPDGVLVSRWQRGDLAAASTLLQRYEALAYATAWRVVHDRRDAEDLAQEAFLRAHERIAGLRDGGAFGSWLRQIT